MLWMSPWVFHIMDGTMLDGLGKQILWDVKQSGMASAATVNREYRQRPSVGSQGNWIYDVIFPISSGAWVSRAFDSK